VHDPEGRSDAPLLFLRALGFVGEACAPAILPRMLETIELETGAEPRASIVWLHGLGADGHDFEPIVPELRLPPEPALRFVFPHAPERAVTINGGMRMRAWYDFLSFDLGQGEAEPDIDASIADVRALLEREESRGIAPERIVLAGFSQGGVIALELGLRYPRRLAGIIALSTYLARPAALATERTAAGEGLAVFLGHGSMDPVIPVAFGRAAAESLAGWGYAVEAQEYPMPHSVHPQEIEDIARWLGERLV
jgi:phospholipase/carboxylesterase